MRPASSGPKGMRRFPASFPLDRQSDEKEFRLFFGIGQAFQPTRPVPAPTPG